MPGDRAITTLDHHPHRRWGWGLVAALAAGLLVAGLVLVTSTRTGKPGTVSVQPTTVQSGGQPGHSRSGLGTGTQATRGPLGTTVTTEGPRPQYFARRAAPNLRFGHRNVRFAAHHPLVARPRPPRPDWSRRRARRQHRSPSRPTSTKWGGGTGMYVMVTAPSRKPHRPRVSRGWP